MFFLIFNNFAVKLNFLENKTLDGFKVTSKYDTYFHNEILLANHQPPFCFCGGLG